MIVKPFLTSVAVLAVLTACGGGGGGGGSASPPMQPPPMQPPSVQVVGPYAVTATHLEMTDNVFTVREPGRVAARDPESEGTQPYTRTRRDEVVCAGSSSCVFPSGQDGGRNAHDGVWHPRSKERDESIAFHRNILSRGSVRTGQVGGLPAFRVDVSEPTKAEIYGGWGNWSAFYAVWEIDSLNALDLTWSAAFGDLTGARPTAIQGSATWGGAMVGRTRVGGVEVEGRSRLVYDFAGHSLDLTLVGIAPSGRAAARGQSYDGPGGFAWENLPVSTDGTFGLPASGNDRAGTDLHPTLGQVEGAFYGPAAGEAAGVFERGGVAGAFGARRE